MLDESRVQALAKLARIKIEDVEVPALAFQLSRILTLVEQMNEIDTTGVDPLAHPLELVARRRPDLVTETDQREQLQAGAPAVANGYFLVPRVLE
jgi:aspartyl-tRNA(Asn)/glutamyl-tRNA(Gln) amidotransferase subunit C